MSVSERKFGTLPTGEEVKIYHLENKKGAYAEVLQYGAILVKVCVPDKNGELKDVVLGYDDMESYEVNGCFFGAIIGRSGNRIENSRFFIDDKEVELYGVEPMGKGEKIGEHSATLTYGQEGIMHGFNSIMLKDEQGNPAPVYSIGSGIDYPGVGPEHAYLKESGRSQVGLCNDDEAVDAFYKLSQLEGIIPALESAHAVGFAMKLASSLPKDKTILVNLSGRGDKDTCEF